MKRLIALGVLCVTGCSAPNVPPHDVIGIQGMIAVVVVSPDVAKSDGALWMIADTLRRDLPGQAIQAMFWTSHEQAPKYAILPISDTEVATLAVDVSINPHTGLRALTRP